MTDKDTTVASPMEEARKPFHTTIYFALIVCVRQTAELPSDFEAGLLPLYALLDLLDKTKIPPLEVPKLMRGIYDLQRKYQGQGPAQMCERLGRAVEFLGLYQAEMVADRRLPADAAWSVPTQVITA